MTKYSPMVIERVRQNLYLEADDESKDDEIEVMSRHEVLSRCLNWEGLIGYSPLIRRLIENIYDIELK